MFISNFWIFYGSNGDRHWYPLSSNQRKFPDPSIHYKKDHSLIGIDATVLNEQVNLLYFIDYDQYPVLDTIENTRNISINRHTSAINIKWRQRKEDGFGIDFDAAYQFGSIGQATGSGDISAYMLSGEFNWRFQSIHNLSISTAFHILSGDEGTEPNKIRYFFDGYNSKHRWYGYMDYFKSSTGTKSLGLVDLILRGKINPMQKLSIRADIHHFRVQKAFQSQFDGRATRILGSEIDTYTKYALKKNLTGELGIDIFFPSDNWQGSNSDWASFIYFIMTAKI